MPKKFKGENTKAQDAKARKTASKEAADEKRKREEEDTAWRDDDKHVARKQDRKVSPCFAANLARFYATKYVKGKQVH